MDTIFTNKKTSSVWVYGSSIWYFHSHQRLNSYKVLVSVHMSMYRRNSWWVLRSFPEKNCQWYFATCSFMSLCWMGCTNEVGWVLSKIGREGATRFLYVSAVQLRDLIARSHMVDRLCKDPSGLMEYDLLGCKTFKWRAPCDHTVCQTWNGPLLSSI